MARDGKLLHATRTRALSRAHALAHALARCSFMHESQTRARVRSRVRTLSHMLSHGALFVHSRAVLSVCVCVCVCVCNSMRSRVLTLIDVPLQRSLNVMNNSNNE